MIMLETLQDRLDYLRSLEENWYGYGEEVPSEQAIGRMLKVLPGVLSLGDEGLRCEVGPVGDGGVAISVSRLSDKQRVVGVYFDNDHDGMIATAVFPEKNIHIWPWEHITQETVNELHNFLRKAIAVYRETSLSEPAL
jgi:hypothetical protein